MLICWVAQEIVGTFVGIFQNRIDAILVWKGIHGIIR